MNTDRLDSLYNATLDTLAKLQFLMECYGVPEKVATTATEFLFGDIDKMVTFAKDHMND